MKPSKTLATVFIPSPDDLRDWLRLALPLLGHSPTSLATEMGLGRNALSSFLKGDSDLRLNTAARVVRELRALAAARDVRLPEFAGLTTLRKEFADV